MGWWWCVCTCSVWLSVVCENAIADADTVNAGADYATGAADAGGSDATSDGHQQMHTRTLAYAHTSTYTQTPT